MRDESHVTQVEEMSTKVLVLDLASSCKCFEAKPVKYVQRLQKRKQNDFVHWGHSAVLLFKYEHILHLF